MPLIVFDGPDGSGKTTVLDLVYDHLTIDLKLENVERYRQPGATPLGEALRAIIKSKQYSPGALAERLMFAADHAQFVTEVLLADPERGRKPLRDRIVLVDRFSFITDVIYGHARGLDVSAIRRIQDLIPPVKSDFALFFTVPYDVAQDRKELRKAASAVQQPSGYEPTPETDCRIEAATALQAAVSGIYSRAADPQGLIQTSCRDRFERSTLIDANRELREVAADAITAVEEELTLHGTL